MFLAYSLALLLLALLPAALTYKNLQLFQRAARDENATDLPSLSVLIPARNEASGIAATLQHALANQYPGQWEVLVLDDHSEDETAEIVSQLAQDHPELKLHRSPKLPEGWNGKQHACWNLAGLAEHELLLFLDADVHLQPDALQRLVLEWQRCNGENELALLSGFPQQLMGTWSEHWLIPMMYVLLLGYLPLEQMRKSKSSAFGAGCGQLFLAKREAYFTCQGHQAIRESRHDGLKLPRNFRESGFASDVFDASDIAQVRMYHSLPSVMNGLLKNAHEGIARFPLIAIFSILLFGGFVLPLLSFPHALYHGWSLTSQCVLGLALLLSWLPRWMIAQRLGHPFWHSLVSPFAVVLFLATQWIAFLRQMTGMRPPAWRGR